MSFSYHCRQSVFLKFTGKKAGFMKRIFCLTLILTVMQSYAHPQTVKRTIVLVHAQWHGAWCWSKIVPLLQAKGFNVVTFDLPGHGQDTTAVEDVTLQMCVDKVVAQASLQSGSVMLLGHSSGGIVISQAAEQLGNRKVSSLLFLDAFLPNDGESVFSLAEKYGGSGTPLGQSLIVSGDGKIVSLHLERVQELLYEDCSQADLELAGAKLRSSPISVLATPVNVTSQNYGSIPKYYILCTSARDMHKSELAKNVVCEKVFTLKSSHSPFFSIPGELADLIEIISR
jgi:pimeloyl-ACP methyl ester carboxylesterase